MLTPAEVATFLQDKRIRVTDRLVHQTGKGWVTRCGYGTGRVGLALNAVEVTTDVGPGAFKPYQPKGDPAPKPLHGLGDQAWIYTGPGPDGAREVRVQVLQGSTAVLLDFFVPSKLAKDPVDVATQITGKAVARVPGRPRAVLRTAKKPCTDVDLAKAAKALGETPRTARIVEDGTGDIACTFGGTIATLSVSRWTRIDVGAFDKDNRPNLKGIGDRASFTPAQFGRGFEATIRRGDRALVIRATYASRHPSIARTQPDAAERALLTSLAKPFGP